MNTIQRKKYNRHLIGPGGWNCPCCAPPKKFKQLYKRMIKHKEKNAEIKLEIEQYEDQNV